MSQFSDEDARQAVANAVEAMRIVSSNAGIIWNKAARIYLERYWDAFPGEGFLTEDVRKWAYENGMPKPPTTCRAWGPIIRSAKDDGLIEFVTMETTRNPNSHGMPVRKWRQIGVLAGVSDQDEYDPY